MSQHQRGRQSLGHKRPDQRPEAQLQGSHETSPLSRQFAQNKHSFSGRPHAFGVVPLPPPADRCAHEAQAARDRHAVCEPLARIDPDHHCHQHSPSSPGDQTEAGCLKTDLRWALALEQLERKRRRHRAATGEREDAYVGLLARNLGNVLNAADPRIRWPRRHEYLCGRPTQEDGRT